MNKFSFLKALFSPFKPFKLQWYVGKIAIGTPYFFPRRWVKDKDKPGYLKAVPRKIGFDFVSLGWKTKYRDDDYRFEWAPLWSFVFFKWQIVVTFAASNPAPYWESWLYYEYSTDKTKSKAERIAQCRKKAPQTWIIHEGNTETKIDYYDEILKKKYL